MPDTDCCPGEPAFGDPRGLHSDDCPFYLASMAALEARRANAGADLAARAGDEIADPTGLLRELAALRAQLAACENDRQRLRRELAAARNEDGDR